MTESKLFPDNMVPLADEPFSFSCHPGVPCFTVCCKKVDLTLYPYDIVRLKNGLGIRSDEFLQKYARVVQGDNPFFPMIMLSLTEEGRGQCPFLTAEGCTVYADRPSSCRTYPLERAVDRHNARGRSREFYFMVRHDYCKGHEEQQEQTVKRWVRGQRLEQFNTFNDLWAEMDSLFRSNPWKGEGVGGPGQQLAFMVCYNIDQFRDVAEQRHLLEQFRLNRDQRRAIERGDEELLKFGFEWLKLIFGGKSSLIKK